MTLPDERLRAIGWGQELLHQVVSDTTLPKSLIAAAQRIALTYPALKAIEDRISSGAHGLPSAWTAALFDALELFDELRAGALGSALTRSDLTYTLRHYPDRMTIRTMSRGGSIAAWLQRPAER